MSISLVYNKPDGTLVRQGMQACFGMTHLFKNKGDSLGIIIDLFEEEEVGILYDMLCSIGYKSYLMHSKRQILAMNQQERYVMLKGHTPFLAGLAGLSLCRIKHEHERHWRLIKKLLENGCDPHVAWIYGSIFSLRGTINKLQFFPAEGHAPLNASVLHVDCLKNIRKWQFNQRGEEKIRGGSWNHILGVVGEWKTYTKSVGGFIYNKDRGAFTEKVKKASNIAEDGQSYKARFKAQKSNDYVSGMVWMYKESGLSDPPADLLKFLREAS